MAVPASRSRIATLLVLAVAVAVAVAATGCGSTDPSGGGGASGGGRDPATDQVSIPPEVANELDAWGAEAVTLIGDVVEIDATATPFAAELSISVSRDVGADGRRVVERTETVDAESGARTITLVNRAGYKVAVEMFPSARLAFGRKFLARDRLVVRYLPPAGMDRPVSFSAVASGRASLVQGGAGQGVLRSGRIAVRADVVRGPRGYEFRGGEEKLP